jgi:hypothetical protein
MTLVVLSTVVIADCSILATDWDATFANNGVTLKPDVVS